MPNKKTDAQKNILKLGKRLTPLQTRFVHNLLKPEAPTQRVAYVDAGGTAKTPATQDSSASTMFRNVKVSAYYDAILEESASNAIITREAALRVLSDAAETAIDPDNEFRHVQLPAIKQLSTMQGWDAPKKSELSGPNGQPLAIKSDVSAPEIAAALEGLMGKL